MTRRGQGQASAIDQNKPHDALHSSLRLGRVQVLAIGQNQRRHIRLRRDTFSNSVTRPSTLPQR